MLFWCWERWQPTQAHACGHLPARCVCKLRKLTFVGQGLWCGCGSSFMGGRALAGQVRCVRVRILHALVWPCFAMRAC